MLVNACAYFMSNPFMALRKGISVQLLNIINRYFVAGIIVVFLGLSVASSALAGEELGDIVFGPKSYKLKQGRTNQITAALQVEDLSGGHVLEIRRVLDGKKGSSSRVEAIQLEVNANGVLDTVVLSNI
jgi:hypothetical protein